MKICPYCNVEQKDGCSFGAHLTNCKMNPKYEESREKARTKIALKRKKYIFNCKKCNKEFDVTLTENNYNKGKYKKYCSKSCSSSDHIRTEESKLKTSIKLKKLYPKKIILCNVCHKEITKSSKTHLCVDCLHKNDDYRNKISKSSIGKNIGDKNGMYGISPKNTKNFKVHSDKNTTKKDFSVRSSYEKIFIDILNNDNDVTYFTYEPKQYRVKYEINGRKRTYQPDFLINDNKIIEIKNRWNVTLDETTIKKNAFIEQYKDIDYKIIFW